MGKVIPMGDWILGKEQLVSIIWCRYDHKKDFHSHVYAQKANLQGVTKHKLAPQLPKIVTSSQSWLVFFFFLEHQVPLQVEEKTKQQKPDSKLCAKLLTSSPTPEQSKMLKMYLRLAFIEEINMWPRALIAVKFFLAVSSVSVSSCAGRSY